MSFSSHIFGKKYAPDVVSFSQAAGLTDPTHISAVQQLESDLKTNNLWDKMYAVYPFVGGTAFTHKFNLKDPRDLDEAFRFTFDGGSHNSEGFQTSTSPNYNHFVPDDQYINNTSAHISIYTSNAPVNLVFSASQNDIEAFRLENTSINFFDGLGGFGNGRVQTTKLTASVGLITGSRISNTSSSLFHNSVKKATKSQTNINGIAPKFSMNLKGSDVVCSFGSIGLGLTDSEVIILNGIVQNYQTTLGRQI